MLFSDHQVGLLSFFAKLEFRNFFGKLPETCQTAVFHSPHHIVAAHFKTDKY